MSSDNNTMNISGSATTSSNRNDSSANSSPTGGSKKRKVWARSIPNKSPGGTKSASNTGNPNMGRNADNAPFRIEGMTPDQLEATIMGMNPEDREKYRKIQTAHMKRSGSGDNRSRFTGRGSGIKGGAEVRISFGPSRPPYSSNASNERMNMSMSAASMAAMMGMAEVGDGATVGSINFGDIDLESLKEKAAAAAAGQNSFRNKNGIPCTEAEMKALMSMFVEIMGVSMNNNKSDKNANSSTHTGNDDVRSSSNTNFPSSKSGSIFSFGSNPMDASCLAAMAAAAGGTSGVMPDHMAAATAGFFADGASWEAIRRTYATAEQMVGTEADDDDDDDENFENRELTFEEVEFLLHHRKQKEEAVKLASQFASGDWESIEQVAINDHMLGADDKERKALKKRQKKQRRKAKLKEEAAQKAAEAAQKKRDKAIVSWRSRVVSACQSNEITKLEGLLQESPLRKLSDDENDNEIGQISSSSIISHLEFLLPNSVAKNRSHVERGIEARLRLAEYILQNELLLAFKPLRSGRTAFHTACFHGDIRFLQLLFDNVESYEPNEGREPLPESFLNMTCDESGWSPLHYATVSASSETLELLLEKGCSLSVLTDVTHTWKKSDGTGLTSCELVKYVRSADYEKTIETHGLALQEVTNAFFNHHQERRAFLKKLERVYQRLSDVEKHGYVPLSTDSCKAIDDTQTDLNETPPANQDNATVSKKKNKKKKKKKQSGKVVENKPSGIDTKVLEDPAKSISNDTKEQSDPLITALLGMGFNEKQIFAAVKACGGTHRATADDLVTWILGQGDDDAFASIMSPNTERNQQSFADKNQKSKSSIVSNKLVDEQAKKDEEARQKQEETARRLAAKREEARRRNREWNNREQARQEQEAKAKVAQKLFGANRQQLSSQPLRSDVASSLSPHGSHVAAPTPNYSTPGRASIRQIPIVHNSIDAAGISQWENTSMMKQTYPYANFNHPKTTNHYPVSSAQTLAANQHISGFYPGIIEDDKTVSSFGSNRGLSVSSKEFIPAKFTANPSLSISSNSSIPPPGFMSTSQHMNAPIRATVATVPENSSSLAYLDSNHQGEIRATAKAFVPSNFVPSPLPDDSSAPKDFFSSQEKIISQTGFPSRLLHGASNQSSSLVSSTLPDSFELIPSVTPASEDSTAPGSFLVNAAKEEETPLPISFAFARDKSDDSNNVSGSKLLSSISMNASAGSTSIWGDNQIIPSLESSLHPSFFETGNQKSASNDEKSNTWSLPGTNLPNVNGKGSIW